MKVLVIPEYDTFGGTFTFLKRLLEIHAAHAIETAVLVEERQCFPAALAFYDRYGVRMFLGHFVKSRFAPLADLCACWRACRDFQPDLIVVSNAQPGIMTGIFLYPAPVVFFMHTYPGEDKLPLWGRLYLAAATRLRNRIVSVSEFAARKISMYMGIPRDRIAVVHNGVAPVVADGGEQRQALVLTIGHVTAYKNPALWLRVAEQVVARRPGVRFIWLGSGDLLQSMRELASNAGLAGAVEFHGYCDDVQRFYRQAAVYFQPSLMESHGISVIEAMGHGIACVTSDAGGLPESVVHGETGFTCPPYDVELFVTRLLELLDDSPLRVKLGAAGKARVEKLFAAQQQERSVMALYAELSRAKVC